MDRKKFTSELLWMFNVHYPKGSNVKSHAHKFHYQFICVVSGLCTYVSQNARYTLRPGLCTLLPPGGAHAIECVEEDLTTYELKFLVDDAALEKALSLVPTVFEEDTLAHELVQAILAAADHPNSQPHKLAFSNYLGSLLCHIAEPYFEETAAEEVDTSVADPLKGMDARDTAGFSDATKAAIRYINENYMHSVSLDGICEFINYNKSYLCYVFKKDTDKTVNDYLTYVRVKTAAELIVFSDCNLAQVCARTGFKTVSHFSRVFKKTIGIPPGLYKSAFPEDTIIADLISMEITDETRAALSKAVLLEFSKQLNSSENVLVRPDLGRKES